MSTLSPSIPTDQLSIGYYYKIRNIKGAIATRVGMLLYTFVVEGKNYAKFMDLVDESKKIQFPKDPIKKILKVFLKVILR